MPAATENVTGIITFTKATGETVAAYERVKRNSSGQVLRAGAGEPGIGTVCEEYNSSRDPDNVPVRLYGSPGSRRMLASGAIAAGAVVFATASGRIDDAMNMGCIIGTAKQAASGSGSVIEVEPYGGEMPAALLSSLPAGIAASATLAQHMISPGKVAIRITLTADVSLGAYAGGAALGLGTQCLDLPTGIFNVDLSKAFGTFVVSGGGTTAGEIGVGTVVASGAVAVLGGTATFENVLEGGVPALGNSATSAVTAFNTGDLGRTGEIGTISTASDLFINFASTFAAGAGTVTIKSGSVFEFILNIVPQTTT